MSDITERAMLVNMTCHQWQAKKEDKQASKKVAETFNLGRSSQGKYVKDLIAKESLAAINSLLAQARIEHYKRTLPWCDGGEGRILAASGFFDYKKAIDPLIAQLGPEVDKFVDAYPQLYKDAQALLGTLFNEGDYPDPKRIRAKFGIDVRYFNLPHADDFRVSLGKAEEARIRQSIEYSMNRALEQAVTDVYVRAQKLVSEFHSKLNKYSEAVAERAQNNSRDGRAGRFGDTLTEGLTEFAELLPSLNITSNPALTALGKKIANDLCKYDPQTIRESPQALSETMKAADAILKKMEAFIA